MATVNNLDKNYCSKCGHTKKKDQFYITNNLEKYPDGIVPICKKCLTMHVDNFDSSTYLWILKELDVPYVPREWNALLANYCQPGKKYNGTTILGRYLSKMRLKQFNMYRWKDTEYLQELDHKQIREALEATGADAQIINDTLLENTFDLKAHQPEIPEEYRNPMPIKIPVQEPNTAPIGITEPNNFVTMAQPEPEEDLGLSEEDKTYLALKWGRGYKQSEWVMLEQFYTDFVQSYDIQTAGHKDTLKKLAKCSLKLDQLIDINDVDGAAKMQRMYDSLMKAGKFTAVQNKENQEGYIDSISEIVAMCEKDGFIPRFYNGNPNDKVDRVLQDYQGYTRNLIEDETNLGNLIESALKSIKDDKEKEERSESDAANETDYLEAELFDNEKDLVLNDEDYIEFNDFEDSLEGEEE